MQWELISSRGRAWPKANAVRDSAAAQQRAAASLIAPSWPLCPGSRQLHRFVGDRIRFSLGDRAGRLPPEGWRARLRTNLGRAEVLCKEIVQAQTKKLASADASWHDLPMRLEGGEWILELPLTETGYFKAKAYFIDPKGWQHWPDGPDGGHR